MKRVLHASGLAAQLFSLTIFRGFTLSTLTLGA